MRRSLAASLLVVLLSVGTAAAAAASFWDHLWRATPRVATLEDVARHIARAPGDADSSRIAAAATDVGHWRLAGSTGEMFTASGPAELHRGIATLAPASAAAPEKLRIYLTPESVFRHPASISDLPKTAAYVLVLEGEEFPLSVLRNGDRVTLEALVGKGLLLELSSQANFEEALHQVRRKVGRATTRVLAFEAGGPTGIRRAPDVDANLRRAKVDAVDPDHVAAALGALAGQLVLAGGRVDGDRLTYKSQSGTEGSIEISRLVSAATKADSDLLVLSTSSTRQPGSRNILWQQVEFANLDKALMAQTVGALMYALAGEPGALVINGGLTGNDRFEMVARPRREGGAVTVSAVKDAVAGTWSGIVSETAGALAVGGMRATTATEARRAELGRRVVPYIPSAMQLAYALLVACGLAGWPVLAGWWSRIWPAEDVAEYGSRRAFGLARLARWMVLAVFFCPVAGLPALLVRLTRGVGAVGKAMRGSIAPQS